MGASWSVMLVTSFKDQGRERWPPDFGIDRKKWESNSFYIPGNIKIICVSLWQMSKRVQWVHPRQNKSRRGDWRTHAVSRFDRYLPWWGWWMCVSRRVDFTGEEKKDPGTRTSLNKKKSRPCATRATPRLQHHANPHIIPVSSRSRHEKEKK